MYRSHGRTLPFSGFALTPSSRCCGKPNRDRRITAPPLQQRCCWLLIRFFSLLPLAWQKGAVPPAGEDVDQSDRVGPRRGGTVRGRAGRGPMQLRICGCGSRLPRGESAHVLSHPRLGCRGSRLYTRRGAYQPQLFPVRETTLTTRLDFQASAAALEALLRYFRSAYFYDGDENSQMRPNDFTDFAAYYVQKAIPAALAQVRALPPDSPRPSHASKRST